MSEQECHLIEKTPHDVVDMEPVHGLLLLCLRSRFCPNAIDEARELLAEQTLNWTCVERTIAREKIAPLVFQCIRGRSLFPPDLEARLHRATIEQATVNAYLLHEMRKIAARLGRVGIDAILLKGAALALTTYDNAYPRLSGDLDLLVHWEDVDKALAAIGELDYTAEANRAVGAAEIVPFVHQWQLFKSADLDIELDLHWHLFGWPYYQHTTPIHWFWETSEAIAWQDVGIRVLSSEASLLHYCIHVHQHSGERWASSLRLLHDIAEIIFRKGEQIDWQLVVDRARDFQLSVPLRQTLLHVSKCWQLALPEEAQVAIQRLQPSMAERRVFAQLQTLDAASEARFALVNLALLPGWGARVQYLARNLFFPHPSYMRHRYKIRRSYLLPFYYPYRWFLGLSSALRK